MTLARRLPRLTLAALGALLLGLLVVRISAAQALLELGPASALALAPEYPEARLQQAHDALRVGGALGEEAAQGALEAFRRAPLSEVPMLVAARAALDRGDGDTADRLLAVALRRNPRSRYGLLLQLEQDLRNRRPTAATRMAVLSRLFADAGGLLVAELARMAADPRNRPALRQVMAEDPQLRGNVLERLARSGADAELVLELAAATGGDEGAGTPQWQRQLLDGLVARGETAAAKRVWRRIAGLRGDAAGAAVYDAGFAGLPGPPPFNWEFATGADGFAEPVSGALQVEYYARREARLASQLILLPPGRHELSFEAEGQAQGDSGRLAWTISCHPNGPVLATVPIAGVDYTPRRIAGAFTVPASGCASQWLRLEGASAEFPKTQQATIRELRIAGPGR